MHDDHDYDGDYDNHEFMMILLVILMVIMTIMMMLIIGGAGCFQAARG